MVVGYESLTASGFLIAAGLIIKDCIEKNESKFIKYLVTNSFIFGILTFVQPRLIVSGIAIGPALISANAFLKELVPLSRLNESFAFLGAAISIGITIGSTLSGVIVEQFDGWKGFYFMTGATALATVISCFGWGFHKEEVARDESNS